MPRFLLIDAGEMSPAMELQLTRGLMGKMAEEKDHTPAILCVSSLTGEGLSLGRFQVPQVAVRLEECQRRGLTLTRRLTGGATAFYGEGIVILSLILSSPSAFSDSIPPVKVINRYVRGLLSGLISLGLNAMYYGGDFLAVNRKRCGYLTLDVDTQGVVLYQTILALDREYLVPDGLSNYPPLTSQGRPDPVPTTLAKELGRPLSREELIRAVAGGYTKRFGVEWEFKSPVSKEYLTKGEPGERGEAPLFVEGPQRAGLVGSKLYEFPLGFFQAWVTLGGEGRLGQVQLTGDLIANSPAIHHLEERLSRQPLIWERLGLEVDQVFADPHNFLIGVKSLKVIPDAIVDAAERAGVLRPRAHS